MTDEQIIHALFVSMTGIRARLLEARMDTLERRRIFAVLDASIALAERADTDRDSLDELRYDEADRQLTSMYEDGGF